MPGLAFTLLLLGIACLPAQETVTVYSARHYGGDADLFGAFEKQTGIAVEVLEDKGGALLEKIKREGANCPADVLITVDAARLGAADQAGVFQPVSAPELTSSIPASLRHPEGHWFGFGRRARITVIAPDRVDRSAINDYLDLADERFRGRIVVRSSGNVYNQSLLAGLIARHGEATAKQWAAGVLANMARAPQGNDRAQIKAVAAGQADIAIVNHYYYARMLNSDDPAEVAAAKKVVLHFPGQGADGHGAHVNISGAGVLTHAPNPEGAFKLLAFLASPEGQRLFVKPSWEYPVAEGVSVDYPMLPAEFKADPVDVAALADNNVKALMIFDTVGWR